MSLSFNSLILYMKFKGVQFQHVSEYDAMEILEYKNYYFKLNSYIDNYPLEKNNYQNQIVERHQYVDFKNLVDLASLDMQLRYIIIKMCLDIEHSLKLSILRKVTRIDNEDGYKIVESFFNHIQEVGNIEKPYNKLLKYLKFDTYRKLDFEKYKKNTPIWFLIEHIQFGDLCWFIEFFCKQYGIKEFKKINSTIRYVKNIRNKAAHNTPVLNNIVLTDQLVGSKKSAIITHYGKHLGISNKVLNKRLKNYNINDLLAMFFVYNSVVMSESMKKHRKSELKDFMWRAKRNKSIYDERFSAVYNFFNKVIENF
ncbi:Abi family protein [Staphylococcus gallinarum]|uniref:Abi family protein n=1 Tax=Staphylococcus gallinarum TaxID=1293 RepID=UPI000D1FCBB1|nr:Abi family protein [Staphylococcus gallinarum]MBU7217591.1 Abi family protein [Staphylococcus gallinarum]MDN6412298.1 Abi family protein [Staphylococcus gallinarum]PTL18519.1 hypothetical protein BUZ08_01005 [Staphylococcus gallinarum]RIO80024.1 Abi family protein [Staphylococcus gallinarum]